MIRKFYIYFILIFISAFLSINCRENEEKMLMSKEKLNKLFFDLHSAEYIISRSPTSKRDSLRTIYYAQILKMNKINDSDLRHDLRILNRNHEKLDSFYHNLVKYSNHFADKELEKIRGPLEE